MSRRDSTNYRKPKVDVYTMMLLMAFLALIIATVVLYLEIGEFGDNPTSGISSPPMVMTEPSPAPVVAAVDWTTVASVETIATG